MKSTKSPNAVDLALAARLKARREKMRVTQIDLAYAAGVSFQMIQKYERGKNRINPGRLERIAKALGTTAMDLMGAPEAPMPDHGFLTTEGAQDLLAAYNAIDDKDLRLAFLHIVEHIARGYACEPNGS